MYSRVNVIVITVVAALLTGCASMMYSEVDYTSHENEITGVTWEQIELGHARRNYLAFRALPPILTEDQVEESDEISSSLTDDRIAIGLKYEGNGWRFIESLTILADEERITLLNGNHDRRTVYGGTVSEWVVWHPTQDQIDTIANAQSLQYQASGSRGSVQQELTNEQLVALRDFIQENR